MGHLLSIPKVSVSSVLKKRAQPTAASAQTAVWYSELHLSMQYAEIYDMTLEVIRTYATAGALIVAIISLVCNMRSAHKDRNVDLMLDFEKRFDSNEMKILRNNASTHLLNDRHVALDDDKWRLVDDVIDFFEVLGICVKQRHVNKELAYKFFFYWLCGYWTACNSYIRAARANNNVQWAEAEWLFEELEQYDRDANASAYIRMITKNLDGFLKNEAKKPLHE
jgi:hypothetical protein